jgi:hypothetical protein
MDNDRILTLLISLVILAVYAGLIVLGVRWAKSKNRSPHWMWFGIHPIGLVVVLIVMACISPLKRCPQCAQKVQSRARLCAFCGYSFGTVPVSPQPTTGVPVGP